MADVLRVEIPEERVEGKALGRHIVHDPRSREFRAETASELVSVSHIAQGLPLDQADVGACTADAVVGAGNSAPNLKPGHPVRTQRDAYVLYGDEIKLEGGTFPPDDWGGSGLMVCRAAKARGWVSSYRHAFGIEHALLALVKRPVITGVSWFASFDDPDSSGLVKIAPGSNIRGGHEIVADELVVPAGATIADLDEILVGLWQSWGPEWGQGGRFYWSAATWSDLLARQGDVTVPYFNV